MKKFILLIAFITSCLHITAKHYYELKGTVLIQNDNEPLIGALLKSLENPTINISTDFYGQYTLSLPEGKHIIECSYIGYETQQKVIELKANSILDFTLKEKPIELNDILIVHQFHPNKVYDAQVGTEGFTVEQMAKVPSLFGERDIIKSMQLLPGVKSEGDGTSGFQVRGGTSSQNLILLDNATIYNAGHLMGFFSTFNDDALSRAVLYKGNMPAQYGDATSAVLDVTGRRSNWRNFKMNGSVGLLSAKLSMELPIVKDKVAAFVAVRRTYLDQFLKLSKDYKNTVMNFYDINTKINYDINGKNFLEISFFSGIDNMGIDETMTMNWGNNAISGEWKFTKGGFNNNLALTYTDYFTDNYMEMLSTVYSFQAGIRQINLSESVNFHLGTTNVNMGWKSTFQKIKSAEWIIVSIKEKEMRDSWQNAFWVNDEWEINRLKGSVGMRVNIFSVLGGSPLYKLDDKGDDIIEILDYDKNNIVKNYYSFEPRISLCYRLDRNKSIKAGYSTSTQNIHTLKNNSSSMPFDRYISSSNIIKPQKADQFSLGYFMNESLGQYEFSVEGYYKNIDNIYDYKDGKSFGSEIELERIILGGKGRSYGMEVSLKKNFGRFNGWASYTLSWTENKINGINNNEWYTANNDRRHDISLVGMFDINQKWSISASWVYNTGQALTAPSAKYDVNGETYYYFAERNGYRAPDYHRLDLSATHTKKKKRFIREWSFGLYNAYNHYNPYIITFQNDDKKPSGTKTIQQSLFGIVPSVSYNFKF